MGEKKIGGRLIGIKFLLVIFFSSILFSDKVPSAPGI
jgi:hypothetical protein